MRDAWSEMYFKRQDFFRVVSPLPPTPLAVASQRGAVPEAMEKGKHANRVQRARLLVAEASPNNARSSLNSQSTKCYEIKVIENSH